MTPQVTTCALGQSAANRRLHNFAPLFAPVRGFLSVIAIFQQRNANDRSAAGLEAARLVRDQIHLATRCNPVRPLHGSQMTPIGELWFSPVRPECFLIAVLATANRMSYSCCPHQSSPITKHRRQIYSHLRPTLFEQLPESLLGLRQTLLRSFTKPLRRLRIVITFQTNHAKQVFGKRVVVVSRLF